MAKVYLGLGTNMGDKEANLRTAVRLINDRIGKVTSLSSFYRTAPWGFVSDNDFLNAAACSETLLDPLEVLHLTQAIEKEMGRTAKSVEGVYSDRPIDIDLLMYDDVRQAASPRDALLAFLQSTYEAAADLGNWDRPALERQDSH